MTSLTRTSAPLLLRRLAVAGALTTVLAGGLTACNKAADTTCGDFAGQSDSDKRDTVKSAAKDIGGLNSDEKDQLDNASDAELDAAASLLTTVCATQDPGTKIKDIDTSKVNPEDLVPSGIPSDLSSEFPSGIPTDIPS